MEENVRIFISYADRDRYLYQGLEKHLALLKKQGLISTWNHRHIGAGAELVQEVNTHLDAAHIILLLVSADFLSSDYCYSVEMKRAIDRHNRGEVCVIPIILSPVDWRNAPFGQLQALPKNGKSIEGNNGRYGRDKAFLEVTLGIREVAEHLKINKEGRDGNASSGMIPATHFSNSASKVNISPIANPRFIEVQYQLYSSYLRATELQRDKLVISGRKRGGTSQLNKIAAEIGKDLHTYFQKLTPQQKMVAQVDIDANGTVHINPPNALILYYAFPSSGPYSELEPRTYLEHMKIEYTIMRRMGERQTSWRLEVESIRSSGIEIPISVELGPAMIFGTKPTIISGASRIPNNPFSKGVKAENQYLEIRYQGYLPAFIPLAKKGIFKRRQNFQVELTPVLNQRIGIVDFLNVDGQPTEVSKILAIEIRSILETYPEVATYAYYDPTENILDGLNSSVKYGNVILNLDDISKISEEMEILDISTISGEGRYLRRKELDIQYLIQGNYRAINS